MADNYSYNDDKYDVFDDDDPKNPESSVQNMNLQSINSESDANLESANPKNPEVEQKEPRLKGFMIGVKWLSLGISIIVAIALGIGLGLLLKYLFNVFWVFWLGVFWGVCAAILNVYKAYKSQMKEFELIANSPKYKERR